MINYGQGTCRRCGKAFDKLSTVQIYCSNQCMRKARYGGDDCKFTDGVQCNFMQCEKCGHNPVVSMQRLRKMGVL